MLLSRAPLSAAYARLDDGGLVTKQLHGFERSEPPVTDELALARRVALIPATVELLAREMRVHVGVGARQELSKLRHGGSCGSSLWRVGHAGHIEGKGGVQQQRAVPFKVAPVVLQDCDLVCGVRAQGSEREQI